MAQDINIMVWNVRNMGLYVEEIAELQRNCLSSFLVQLIDTLKLDVLIIQELKIDGIPMIVKIVELLNEDKKDDEKYLCDFVSSYSNQVEGKTSLGMINHHTSEAYGFIGKAKWVNKQEHGFLSSEGYMGLCHKSYCKVVASPQDSQKPSFIEHINTGPLIELISFVNNDTLTIPNADGLAAKDYPKSESEDDRKKRTAERAKTIISHITTSIARRPCRVNLLVNGVSITLLTYHGISKKSDQTNIKARYGASLATLLNEINDPGTCPNVVLAGDFNIVDADSIDIEFSGDFFTKWYTCQTKNKTKGVKYDGTNVNVHHGKYSNPTPLDLMFTSFTEGQVTTNKSSTVLDVPNLFASNSGSLSNIGKQILSSRDWKNLVAEVFSEVKEENPNFKFFETSIKNAGHFSPPLKLKVGEQLRKAFISGGNGFSSVTAALFYYMFISDHLPLIKHLKVEDR